MADRYTFQSNVIPQPSGVETPGQVNGVTVVVEGSKLEWILGKIDSWFVERDEVMFVGSGEGQKSGDGFFALEWEEYEIDPLFLAILKNEEIVIDYALYSYEKEEEGD